MNRSRIILAAHESATGARVLLIRIASRLLLASALIASTNPIFAAQSCGSTVSIVGGASTDQVKVRIEASGRANQALDDWACVIGKVQANRAIREVIVEFAPGVHRVAAPMKLPSLGRPLAITLMGKDAWISGAKPLYGWKPAVNAHLVGNPALPIAGKYQVDIDRELAALMRSSTPRDHGKRTAINPPELYINRRLMLVARHPDSGYLSVVNTQNDEGLVLDVQGVGDGITLQRGLIGRGFLFHDWADSEFPIFTMKKVGSDLVRLGISRAPKYGVKVGGRLVLEGLVDFISQPGEYALAAERDALLLWPSEAIDTIELSAATEAIIAKSTGARVTIKDLSFYGFRGSVIRIEGDGTILENITILGGGHPALHLSGDRVQVRHCRISDVAGTGVALASGDRQTLRHGASTVQDCVIERFGLRVWSSVPAIRVDGVGVEVMRNLITDGPHAGIFFFGMLHSIANNEVSRVATRTGDVGAIYTGRDLAARGNVVYGNFIHDVHGVGKLGATAIYVDDQASGVQIESNTVDRVHRGVLVGGGRDNVVRQNLFIDVSDCIVVDDRGLNWQKDAWLEGSELLNGLERLSYVDEPFRSRFPALTSVRTDRPGVPVNNIVANNVGPNCKWRFADAAVRTGTFLGNRSVPISLLDSGSAERVGPVPGIRRPSIDWASFLAR